MKAFKCVVAAMLIFAMVMALAACGTKENDKGENKDNNKEITGQKYDTGNISLLIPDGWVAIPAKEFNEDKVNPLRIGTFKGASGMDDYYLYPGINVTFAPDTTYVEVDLSSSYDEYTKIDSIEIGGRTWSGFSGKSANRGVVSLHADEGSGYVSIEIWTDASEGKITTDDADVQAIIASLSFN